MRAAYTCIGARDVPLQSPAVPPVCPLPRRELTEPGSAVWQPRGNVAYITALVASSHSERHTVLCLSLREVSLWVRDRRTASHTPRPPLTDGASLWRPEGHGWHGSCFSAGLALLVISSSRSAIEHKAQHDGPGVPPLAPGAPRVDMILLWLLGFCKPSMPSGSTTTRESRHI